MMIKALSAIETAQSQIEQAAREIYYAMTYLHSNSPARINLNIALDLLGVSKPKDVGLSNSVLERRR